MYTVIVNHNFGVTFTFIVDALVFMALNPGSVLVVNAQAEGWN